ncbi:MAG: type IV toxin-antitoxin system AbiEi family antitoxin domain-containing protein [bacterium]
MKQQKIKNASRWVDELLADGRYTFSRKEIQRALGVSPRATYLALHRMVKDTRLVMPKSGFYVVVDPQHRVVGTPPAHWFIHSFMEFMRTPYYVGLLSAAEIHSAAHHRPQEFQVVVPAKVLRPRTILIKNLRIRFFSKSLFNKSETVQVKTQTGYEAVSTPETTAWDLVRYYKSAGGLDNVITVLSELGEKLDSGKLLSTVKRHEDPFVARRLGWLLDRAGWQNLTPGLAKWVGNKEVSWILLDPREKAEKPSQSKKWRILVNTELEPEA